MRPSVVAILLGLVTVSAGCGSSSHAEGDYTSRLAGARTAKDVRFQRGSDPVPDGRKTDLLPLGYFPIDPSYNVPASLQQSSDATIVLMPTSTGQTRRERRAGALEFTLKGQPMTLTAFVEADATDLNHLFVPFSDLTSGTETYRAGRYLDLDRTSTGYYDLDFNTAYHPYCYYNFSYECPLPPIENRLKIPVHAGEKLKTVQGRTTEGRTIDGQQ